MVYLEGDNLRDRFLMTYKFVYYSKNQTVNLNDQEKRELVDFFPKINFTNVVKLGPATDNFKFQSRENDALPEICAKYGCDVKEIAYAEIEINNTKILRQIPIDFCSDSRFHCFKYKIFSLNYNCIGWSLGIREWINPRFDDKRVVQKENLGEFISEVKEKYPENHPKNIIPILDKLEIISELCPFKKEISFNNRYKVAFYFKNDQLQHGARYVEILDEKEVTAWTSKLGAGLLISHSLDDLSGSNGNISYGEVECMGTINLEKSFNQEL